MGLVTIITDNTNAGIKHTIILPKSVVEIDKLPYLVLKIDNIDKAKKILNWKPVTEIEDGIDKTYNYFESIISSEK